MDSVNNIQNFELESIAKALGSDTRLKILKLLVGKNLSSIEVYKEYKKKFNDGKHRETIYRALEILLDSGILDKHYDKKTKNVVYYIEHKELIIDLINQNVKTKEVVLG